LLLTSFANFRRRELLTTGIPAASYANGIRCHLRRLRWLFPEFQRKRDLVPRIASLLNSERAVEMSIFVVRAFVRMREALATNLKIVAKLKDLELRVEDRDADIEEIRIAIRELMTPAPSTGRRIGFEIPAAKRRVR
jgi:hypothetical protein